MTMNPQPISPLTISAVQATSISAIAKHGEHRTTLNKLESIEG